MITSYWKLKKIDRDHRVAVLAIWPGTGNVMRNLEKYVGRIVRLKHEVYCELAGRGKQGRTLQENFFLVAAVRRGMHKLVCYGANLRIDVDIGDVVLI